MLTQPEPQSADELEALALRYSSAVVLLVPISNDRVAVFGNDRNLIGISTEMISISDLQHISAECTERIVPVLRVERLNAPKRISSGADVATIIDPEEL